jgi:hypothetical protein
MLEPEVIERIRTIFLHQRPHVSIADATALLGWTRAEMSEAIRAGEIETNKTATGEWIWREELCAKALELWSFEAIEEALGRDADDALPSPLRLTDLHVRIPRYHLAMLEHLAGRDQTTVSHVLTRELDGVAGANAEELSRSVVGFDDAMQWPNVDDAQLPC